MGSDSIFKTEIGIVDHDRAYAFGGVAGKRPADSVDQRCFLVDYVY